MNYRPTWFAVIVTFVLMGCGRSEGDTRYILNEISAANNSFADALSRAETEYSRALQEHAPGIAPVVLYGRAPSPQAHFQLVLEAHRSLLLRHRSLEEDLRGQNVSRRFNLLTLQSIVSEQRMINRQYALVRQQWQLQADPELARQYFEQLSPRLILEGVERPPVETVTPSPVPPLYRGQDQHVFQAPGSMRRVPAPPNI